MNRPEKNDDARVAKVRSVARAAAILRAFTAQAQHLGLAEIARATGLGKATARRILLTLADAGLVAHDPATQRYSLGLDILELGAAVPEAVDLRVAAAPILAELAETTRSTAFLSVHREGRAICIDRVHSDEMVQVSWWRVGGELPMNCGAAPPLLLAFRPDAEIEAFLKSKPAALTPKSAVDPAALRKTLARIRRRRWHCAIDDVVLGLAAIAAPVLDRAGRVVAAVSIGGLTPQLTQRGRPVKLDAVLQAAERIAARLGR